MKKYSINYPFRVLALVGVLALVSCSSTDEVAEVNPGYDPATGEVPVEFVLNVSSGYTPTTRMSAATVQADYNETFRGIDVSALVSNRLSGTNLVSSAVTIDKQYNLGTIFGTGDVGPSATKSNRVLELSLPVGTNNMMFWGKAKRGASYDANKEGSIGYTLSKDLTQCSFTLQPRLSSDKVTEFGQYQSAIAKVLNIIVQSQLIGTVIFDPESTTPESTTIDAATPLKWSDFAEINTTGTGKKLTAKTTTPLPTVFGSGTDMSALGEILANAFASFNSISDVELRAGSGPAVERMLADLYTVINKVYGATATTLQEQVAQQLGIKIKERLDLFLETGSTGGKVWKSSYNETATTNLTTNFSFTDAEITALAALSTNTKKFPANFNLPEGATVLQDVVKPESEGSSVIKEVTYSYRATIPTYDMGGGTTGTFDIKNYMYPAELCYFGNSPIRVTDDTHTTDDFPNGTTNWMNDDQWAAGVNNNTIAWTKNGTVKSSTRSVAMQQNINYGTALLNTQIKYGAAILHDNNSGIHPADPADPTSEAEADKNIPVNVNSFKLTGICIGGQETEMGWNYVAKSLDSSTDHFDKMIYDNDIQGSGEIPAYTEGGAWSTPNYTMVWDNWNQDQKGNKQNVVYVALEFQNNTGMDFWGENNLIRAGGTFYITAKLDPDSGLSPTDRSAGIMWPTDYALPPYDTDGSTIKERRVFIQDYVTTAKFVIGVNSLKHALVSVPDLREAQMSVGLSVDLEWNAGLSFNDITLGQ